MTKEILDRIELGRRYMDLLAAPPYASWAEGYARMQLGELDVLEAILLAHPFWLRDPSRQELIQGRRQFPRTRVSHIARCRADAVWGYGCQLDEPIQFDHRFPYAFGGPTTAENRLPLCRLHNASKGSDVHLFPWRDELPGWLRPQLSRMKTWT